jgi:hypothetical protein
MGGNMSESFRKEDQIKIVKKTFQNQILLLKNGTWTEEEYVQDVRHYINSTAIKILPLYEVVKILVEVEQENGILVFGIKAS